MLQSSGQDSRFARVTGDGDHDHASSGKIGAYAWYALTILTLIYVLNFVDRQLITILAEDIKRQLGLTDSQIGTLYGTAFGILYMVFGIPFGRLADKWHRPRLIAFGLATWSVMTALSAGAHNYLELSLVRMGVGAGEAMATVATFSLVADYFPKERRGLALALLMTGSNIGGAISLPLGATIASSWNRAFTSGPSPLGLAGWQAAFLIVGSPGLLLALWASTIRESPSRRPTAEASPGMRAGAVRYLAFEFGAILPPLTLFSSARHRGGLARNLTLLGGSTVGAVSLALLTHDTFQWLAFGVAIYAVGSWMQNLKRTDQEVWRLTFGTPAFVMLIVCWGCLSAVNYAVSLWTPVYVLRTFYSAPAAPGHFFTTLTAREEVGYFSMMTGVGLIAGVIFGGWLSDRWWLRDVRGRLAVVALSLFLYVPLLTIMYTSPTLIACFICWPFLAATSQLFWGGLMATIYETVSPPIFTTAGALVNIPNTLIGLTVGPYVVGKVAQITNSISAGVLSLCVLMVVVLCLLWQISQQLVKSEYCRAVRAGERPKFLSRKNA